MGASNNTAKEIDLGNGFGDVAVRANGIRVELHADGSVAAYTQRDVDAYTDGAVHVHPAANDSGTLRDKDKLVGEGVITEIIGDPQIGDKMPAGHPQAGWIYAGVSQSTHQPFYVAPKDSGVFQWKEAMAFAGKDGSRVPSKEELDQIYDVRHQGALKGTFNVTGSLPAGWYSSSSQDFGDGAWIERFSDGDQFYDRTHEGASLRCVR